MGIKNRETIIAEMRKAFKAGKTVTQYLDDKREKGEKVYRRTTLLGDWRTIAGIAEKKDRLKFVRRDYFPPISALVDSTWGWAKEFNYKMKAFAQVSPGQPLTEYWVTIQSDTPLTPMQMESQVFDKWSTWEPYGVELLIRVEPVVGIRRKVK